MLFINWILIFDPDFSDIIAFISIIVNIGLSIYIVRSIQSQLTNKRSLKDYFIEEVKELKCDFSEKLKEISRDEADINTLLPWFKEMNQKCSELDSILLDQYNLENTSLSEYPVDLRKIISGSEDFEKQYRKGGALKLSPTLDLQIRKFRSSKKNIFHKIIIAINNKK